MTNKQLQDKLKRFPDTHDIGLVLHNSDMPNNFIAGKLAVCNVTKGTMIFLRGLGAVMGDDAPPLT